MTDTGWTWPVARVAEVHDGDTLKLDIDLGFSTHVLVWVRLMDVRAPELSEADGQTARSDLLAWLGEYAPDSHVKVTTWRSSAPLEIRFRQSFIRYVGIVTAPNGAVLNNWLRAKGYIDRGQ